jgi:hypothetical protein
MKKLLLIMSFLITTITIAFPLQFGIPVATGVSNIYNAARNVSEIRNKKDKKAAAYALLETGAGVGFITSMILSFHGPESIKNPILLLVCSSSAFVTAGCGLYDVWGQKSGLGIGNQTIENCYRVLKGLSSSITVLVGLGAVRNFLNSK